MINKELQKIIVIGGGPAGMMAAITAAMKGRSVLLLEKNDQCGKKILATGNGRCNYTNLEVNTDCYNSNGEFAMGIIEKFDNQAVISFFEKLGVIPKYRGNYVYPFSDQAQAIRQVLVDYMMFLGVQIEGNILIKSIARKANYYEINTNKGMFQGEKLIVAAGSRASEKTGSDGSGYELLKNLNVKIKKPLPALTALRSKNPVFKNLAGIRVDACVSLMEKDKIITKDTGELQLTDYGISGIPVFQISGPVVRIIDKTGSATVNIDFLPELDSQSVIDYIKARGEHNPDTKVYGLFVGLLNTKLTDNLIPLFGVKKNRMVVELCEEEILQLVNGFKKFQVEVTDYNSFDYGQVCQGGVSVEQLNANTLEVIDLPGLYVAGEIIDVDGKCGGFNLQWAFSSGYVAGEAAANDSN